MMSSAMTLGKRAPEASSSSSWSCDDRAASCAALDGVGTQPTTKPRDGRRRKRSAEEFLETWGDEEAILFVTDFDCDDGSDSDSDDYSDYDDVEEEDAFVCIHVDDAPRSSLDRAYDVLLSLVLGLK
mmetsp:Transcript_7832/g.25730  ORF Transcript_7832/g.25730 Transcript_7832/m.25730 type:complete len:127 (-) Transcript_7832:238-618(-)